MSAKTRRVHVLVAGILLITLDLLAGDSSATPGTGTLFGTDANGGNLLRIDQATGAGTIVGPMSVGAVPALAVDPATSVMFAGQGGGSPNVYTVDPATGVATFVGDSGLGFAAIGGMDFASDGTLYAAVNIAGDGGTGSDHLATIDKATGAAAILGPFGICSGVVVPSTGGGSCTIEGIEAIAFDASGTLWGAKTTRGRAGAAGLYVIDASTGAATFVTPILDASGDPPSGGVSSLQFACDGTLLGGTATGTFQADGGRLVSIDPGTGLFAFVGAMTATSGQSLGALAFELPECNRPPDCTNAAADPGTLWPPNHLLGTISVVGVTDPDGDPLTITATVVTQDEAVQSTGIGPGNTSPDASLSPLTVRAERNGNPKTPGNGRVYHISFTADDGQGGSCGGTVNVCVPHDQRPGSTCVDGGPFYNSIP